MANHLRLAALAIIIPIIGLAGCQSSRFQPYTPRNTTTAPDPLAPAPSGTVEATELTPPGGTTGEEFPEPPKTEIAATDPAKAKEISKTSMVGTWKANSAGAQCQMFLTLTKYGSVSRGGSRGCAGELVGMRGWDVDGKQLLLYGEGGDVIARLYSSGNERLDGKTSGGEAVSVFR